MIKPAALLLTLLIPLIGQADDGPSMDSLLAKLEASTWVCLLYTSDAADD